MAAEGITTNVAADVIASLIKKAATQARYMYSFNNFVDSLEKEKQELITTQDSIRGRAERAHRRTETIDVEVQTWLEDAENLITEVGELQKKIDMHNAARCCPYCIQRYRLCKKAANKTEELTQHRGNCNFSVFARLATLRGMDYYSSKGFISFESRKQAYDQIVEALKDEGTCRIGLYGMGGCGKTTLVKEVGKEAEKQGLFNKVLVVVVSNTPDTKKIQTSIAGSLGFKFELEEEEPERARRLSMALNNGGKILVILDDVWGTLNFEAIGTLNNCNILLTTREFSVCRTMECQKVISLSILDPMESWILFQKHAGISDDNFDTFKDVGQEIAKECKGLPVAIAAVASSLKGEELDHWEVARDTLRDFGQGDIGPALDDIYKCLKLSYDNLWGEGVKSLFLLCSLFPEDFEISEELLARFAMGLGLFRKVQSNEGIRKQVSVAIKKLIDSCLLLKGEEINTVEMHDLVHDIALQIARVQNKMIIGNERSKQQLEENLILNKCQIRYLFCEMDEFLLQLNCPKLECVIIKTNFENEVEAPYDFFGGMEELRVLVMFNEGTKFPIPKLLKSIESLTNLRCLMLRELELGDVPFLGSFSTIEDLSIGCCSFHELPIGVVNLKNLRLMELEECQIEKNPCDVIKRCSRLEELYFVGNEYPKYKGESSLECSKFKLQRYHIEIGTRIKEFNYNDYSIKRYLSIESFDNHFSDATFVDLIRRAEVLYLGEIHGGCKNIIPDFVHKIGDGMNELTKLLVRDSDEVECLVDMTNSFHHIGMVFSNLTYLEISGMEHLEELFLGKPHHGLLQKLEELHISKCNLKHIIANEPEIISDGRIPRSYDSVFPKLKVISIKECQELEYLMPVSFAKSQLQLENVEIDSASQLKYVFGQPNLDDEGLSCNLNQNEFHMVKLEALKSLTLRDIPNIVSICPENYHAIWPFLDSLQLWDCPQLKIMLGDSEFKQDHTFTKELGAAMLSYVENVKSLFVSRNNEVYTLFHFEGLPIDGQQIIASLTNLILDHLPELKYIWSGPKQFLSLQNLQSLYIQNCEKLEVVFSLSILRSLNQLKKLEIIECQELHQIFEVDVKNKDQSNPHSGHVCLPKLTTLIVQQCNKLKCLFSFTTPFELPKLKFLVIKEASELEEVITSGKSDKKEQMQVMFPELEHIVLVQLPILREVYRGTGLETVRHRVVHHCPKLSLMLSATLENLNEIYRDYRKVHYDEYTTFWTIRNIVSDLLYFRSEEIPSQHRTDPKCLDTKAQRAIEIEMHSSKVDTNAVVHGSEALNYQNGDCIKSKYLTRWQKVLTVASSNLIEGIIEKGKESNQENAKSKETVTAPLLMDLAQSNKGRVEEGPTFGNVTLTRAKSTSSPLPTQRQATSTSFNWLKEKEEHYEGLGNDSKNKHHQENFNSLSKLSTSMPEAQSRATQSEVKSCNWGKFLTLSLFSGPQTVEESTPEKTNYLHTVPEKLPSKVGIIEETENRSVQKSCVSAKSDVNTTSSDVVQNAPTNKPLLVAEEQALKQNEVVELPNRIDVTTEPLNVCVSNASPSNILQEFTTFSAEPISSSSPTLYFSNTPDVGGDILGGFDLNKPPKEFFDVIEQKIQVITTSSNDTEFTTRPSPSSITIPLRSSTSLELLDEQPMSGPKMMDQKEDLEETQIHFQTSNEINRIKKTVEASDQECPKSSKGSDEEVPISSKATNPVPSRLQGQICGSQTKTYVVEELKDDDLVGLLQSLEEDSDTRAPVLLISETAATDLTLEDNLVAKALADLQVSLEVPLKDIASNDAASLRLENALNFLSCHSFEDDIVLYELKASIDSLHQEFPGVLSSFKQASATVDRFTLLEDKEKSMKEEIPQRMESAVTLIGNISKIEISMAEIQQEEASLIEKISRLQDELNNTERRKRGCEARLSSLQEQKNKCIAETKEFKKEFESAKEDKSRMIEDHRKAQEKLFKVNNKWSALCCQFEQNHSATRSLS